MDAFSVLAIAGVLAVGAFLFYAVRPAPRRPGTKARPSAERGPEPGAGGEGDAGGDGGDG